MLDGFVTAGLGVLLAVGAWGLYAGRFDARGGRGQLFVDDVAYLTRADLREPSRLLDPSKAANILIAALETLLLVIATVTVVAVAARTNPAPWFLAVAAVGVLVGGYLVFRGVYVRLGFAVPEPARTVNAFGAGFERVAGTDAAADFTAIHDAMGRTRATGDSDAATAAVLAAARADVDADELRDWAADSGLASPASVDARVDDLATAGLLDPDAFALADDRLATADPEDVAAAATTAVA
ncbi:transcriptional regulator TbsP domain-containing protein [Halorubellus salinus]|uniref:transcriptional regulator TbsP domain-containing protein n=1 Tax=Halorubellus salinus TaxID=755309 RepID=UPI001D05F23D|nr:DUF5821 family protein [Halorubellus salinus]